jgi:hypothetical protein
MSRTMSLVQRVEIASPCTAKWDEMIGDETTRFCGLCKLNVYNLSAMTEEQGEQLIVAKEGKLCARIYRRYDGTVLTKDCPVGLRAVRRRMIWVSMRAAAAAMFVIGAIAYAVEGTVTDDEFELGWHKPSYYVRTLASMKAWLAAPTKIPASASMTMGVACSVPPPKPPSFSTSLLHKKTLSPVQADALTKEQARVELYEISKAEQYVHDESAKSHLRENRRLLMNRLSKPR